MPTESAGTVVFSQDCKQVLLLKRADFLVWVLPGGMIDQDESPADAAIRETNEETGYEVKIDRLIGKYWNPRTRRGGNLQHVYEAHVTGGTPIQNGPETVAVGFFPVERLPSPILGWNRPIIEDALAHFPTAVERTIKMPTWQVILIRVGLKIRDWRNKHILKR
jgi:8-oxo-dGTP diphosphatase